MICHKANTVVNKGSNGYMINEDVFFSRFTNNKRRVYLSDTVLYQILRKD